MTCRLLYLSGQISQAGVEENEIQFLIISCFSWRETKLAKLIPRHYVSATKATSMASATSIIVTTTVLGLIHFRPEFLPRLEIIIRLLPTRFIISQMLLVTFVITVLFLPFTLMNDNTNVTQQSKCERNKQAKALQLFSSLLLHKISLQ